MGQSTSGTTSTSYLPGPQQSVASKFLNNPSTQKIMQAMPVNSADKSRFAGQALTAIGGLSPDSSEDDNQSYANVPVKLAQSKYTKQGSLSLNTGDAAGYTG